MTFHVLFRIPMATESIRLDESAECGRHAPLPEIPSLTASRVAAAE
jgi:hypothetical protein